MSNNVQNSLIYQYMEEVRKAALRLQAAREMLETHHDLYGELQAEVRAQERDVEDALYELNQELGKIL